MNIDLKRVARLVLIAITLTVGVLVLLSFLVDNLVLRLVRGVLVEWTVIVIAFTMLLGIVNVLRVHGRRIQDREGALYSAIVVVSFLLVFVPGIFMPDMLPAAIRDAAGGYVGPSGRVVDFSFRYIQRPLQATLFSLMAFFAFTAAWRVFRIRSASTLVMFIAALLVLLGSLRLNLPGDWSWLPVAEEWIMRVPVLAGARGILLGIALGTAVASLRLLLGIDRPYSEQASTGMGEGS